MLTLTRKAGESIRIGNDVVIVIQEIKGKAIKISIEAPKDLPIYRGELYEKIVLANTEATTPINLEEFDLPEF